MSISSEGERRHADRGRNIITFIVLLSSIFWQIPFADRMEGGDVFIYHLAGLLEVTYFV